MPPTLRCRYNSIRLIGDSLADQGTVRYRIYISFRISNVQAAVVVPLVLINAGGVFYSLLIQIDDGHALVFGIQLLYQVELVT